MDDESITPQHSTEVAMTELVVERNGNIRMIYDESIDARRLGKLEVRRFRTSNRLKVACGSPTYRC